MNLTRSFKWNGATITVHRATIGDRLAIHVITNLLHDGNRGALATYQRSVFAEYVQRSSVDGDLGFPFPTADASAEELRSGLDAFLGMDEALYFQWENTLAEVNVPVNEPALTPAADTGFADSDEDAAKKNDSAPPS
jgi:hypothetical protein